MPLLSPFIFIISFMNKILFQTAIAFACFWGSGVSAQIVINEYSCANWRKIFDYYGETEDWVEFYNTGDSPLNISGYYLSDNKNKPLKWAFPANTIVPANGYLVVWCSGRNLTDPSGALHTSFRLTQTKDNAEHIVFSAPNGNILQDIKIQKTQAEQSWARVPNGDSSWRIAALPTPGAANSASNTFTAFAARPDMDLPPGFYNGPVTVTITSTEPNAIIRYTLNGTEPQANSPVYNQPIVLTKTTVVKAASFSNNPAIHRSFVQFNTYFVNESHTLAVVSVAADGVIELANGNKDLSPMGSIEFFDKNKQRKARTYGELNSHGQDSWTNDQRSLDWVSRDEMGYNNAVKEKLFPFRERTEFQRLILRAAGDDNYPAANKPQNAGSAHVRDAYIHNLALIGRLNLDVRAAEKCVVYLNGNYWGVYDLREIPDDHDYTNFYYAQGKYDLQYVLTWGSTWAEYGDQQAIDDWRAMRQFILTNNMNNPDKFKYVEDHYDYRSLIDYVIVNSFTVCTDWLNFNTGIWRGLNPEGQHRKWGYILWDNDATFDHYINYTGLPSTHYTAKPCNPEGLSGNSDPERHIQVLNKLRTNPEVNRYYVARMGDLMFTVFGCESMLNYLDTIEATIDPEMARHSQRWFGTYSGWKNNFDELRDFITNRCNILPTLMDDCYSVTGPYHTVVVVDPPLAGTVNINTLQYKAEQFPHSQPYFGGPHGGLNLWAVAAEGYKFEHWSANNHVFANPDSSFAFLNLSSADTIVAHFAKKQTSSAAEIVQPLLPTFAVAPTAFGPTLSVRYYLPEISNLNVQLFDLIGNQVFEQAVREVSGEGVLMIDLGGHVLPAGVYFLRCQTGQHEAAFKLIRAN